MANNFNRLSKYFYDSMDVLWPRRVRTLFRPQRWKYIKGQADKKVEGPCIFCNSLHTEMNLDSLMVYKDEHTAIVLNKYPYNAGHLLVIPRLHQGELEVLEDNVYIALQKTLRLAIKGLKEVYSPQGLNVGMNLGKAAGAGIPDHLHYHIIPRWRGDLNFFPLIAETKVIPEALEDSYEKLKKHFDGVKV